MFDKPPQKVLGATQDDGHHLVLPISVLHTPTRGILCAAHVAYCVCCDAQTPTSSALMSGNHATPPPFPPISNPPPRLLHSRDVSLMIPLEKSVFMAAGMWTKNAEYTPCSLPCVLQLMGLGLELMSGETSSLDSRGWETTGSGRFVG